MITFVYIAGKRDHLFENQIKTSSGILQSEFLHFEEDEYAKVYNQALKRAKNDIIIFLRNDVEIHSKEWGSKIIEAFQKSDFSILGIVGSIIVPMSGLTWEKEEPLVGRIWYEKFDAYHENKFSEVFHGRIIPVVAIDDPFIAIDRKKIKKNFDERFTGDSFYDMDFCIQNYKEGCKIGVIFDVKLLKLEFNEKDETWQENRKVFIKKNQSLPLRMKPDIIVSQSQVKISDPPKVSVIIAGKNKPIEMASCLESIYEKTNYPNLEIIVVDLGSKPKDIEAINEFIIAHQNTQLIEIESIHLPEIYNEVIDKYIAADTELLFFCDPEVIMLNDIISKMVKVYQEDPENTGTLGVRMHMRNNMLRHFGLQLISKETEEGHELALGYQGFQTAYKYKNKVIKNVLGSSRDCMMINKSLYNEIGGLNSNYQHNLDDFELNLKTILCGKKNLLVGTAVCYYLGIDIPKFLPEDFMTLVNFINDHVEVFTPYVELVQV